MSAATENFRAAICPSAIFISSVMPVSGSGWWSRPLQSYRLAGTFIAEGR